MTVPPHEALWMQICAGERCCLCDQLLPPADFKGFVYCLACVPEAAELPHPVSLHVDHHQEGFCVHFVSEEPPRFVLWLIRLDRHQVDKLFQRGRTSPSQLQDAVNSMRQWGRTSMHLHLEEDEYRQLRAAAERDPRNGYEKEKALSRRR